jgi:hypothetical protein
MFIADLFEAKTLKILVIMPGGFHPWTPGHMSLYTSALRAFPGADVYVASTNDTSERPIPFAVKQELASIAGVPADHFIQVKSPFSAKEIVDHYDANTTALIFVRSEKDRNQAPQPAKVDPATGELPLIKKGPRKGQPVSNYLQLFTNIKNLLPLTQHAYMAYLPTVEFAGGVTSASEIRAAWAKATPAGRAKIAQTLYPKNPQRALQLLSSVLDETVHEEASGVIASKRQARDPRYSMSLTQDVRPGAINKNLRAFNLAENDPVTDTTVYLIKKYRDDIDYYQELIADDSIDSAAKPHYQKKIAQLKSRIQQLWQGKHQ